MYLYEKLDAGYPKLYELALERAQMRGLDERCNIDRAMTWDRTPEGHGFWSLIQARKIVTAKERYPEHMHLFEDDFEKSNYAVQANGL